MILFLMLLSFEMFFYLLSWLIIFVYRCSAVKRDLLYSLLDNSENIGISSPQGFVSKHSSFLCEFGGATPRVMGEINSVDTT